MIAIKHENRLPGGRPVRTPAENPAAGGPCVGMTLIEVLLALAIFSIGLLAVAGMQTKSVTKNTSSRFNTIAVEYASDYLERLLSLDFDDAALDAGNHTPADIAVHPEFDTTFDLTWTVADATSGASGMPGSSIAAGDEGAIKRITVTVTWSGGHRQISLSSIKSDVL